MQRTTIGNPGILDTPIYKHIRELQQHASIPAQQAAR
jgi:hypothetical protein